MIPEEVITNLQYLLSVISEKILPHIGKVDTQWEPALNAMEADMKIMKKSVSIICEEKTSGRKEHREDVNRTAGKDIIPQPWSGIEDKHVSFRTFKEEFQNWAAAVCPGETGVQGKMWMEAAACIKVDEESTLTTLTLTRTMHSCRASIKHYT